MEFKMLFGVKTPGRFIKFDAFGNGENIVHMCLMCVYLTTVDILLLLSICF